MRQAKYSKKRSVNLAVNALNTQAHKLTLYGVQTQEDYPVAELLADNSYPRTKFNKVNNFYG